MKVRKSQIKSQGSTLRPLAIREGENPALYASPARDGLSDLARIRYHIGSVLSREIAMSDVADIARAYIERGWAPIPLAHKSKGDGLPPGWPNLKITMDTLSEYFPEGTPKNIGILLGKPSGNLVDIDIDSPIARAISKYFLPSTNSVFGRQTSRASHHLYISSLNTKQFTINSNVIIEIRSTGTQTIFPGSVHEGTGEMIIWEKDGTPTEISSTELISAVNRVTAATLLISIWPTEGRHTLSLALAGTLKRAGWVEQETIQFITAICEGAEDEDVTDRVRVVVDTYKADRVCSLHSLYRCLDKEEIVNTFLDFVGVKKSSLISVNTFNEATMKKIHWLWPNHIAFGELTIIAGHSGIGKSQICYNLASIVSTGRTWPASSINSEVGHVLIVNAEDDNEYTVKPRLVANKADCSKVYYFIGNFSDIKTDLDNLHSTVEAHKIKLLILDPITSYLPRIDTNSVSEVRSVLEPLLTFAREADIAIIAVTHLNKKVGLSANDRVIGSTSFTAVSRSVFLVTRDLDNPDRKLMTTVKNSLSPNHEGFAFSLETVNLPGNIEASCVAWEPDSITDEADEVIDKPLEGVRRKSEYGNTLKEINDYIINYVTEDQHSVIDLTKELEELGFSKISIKRAKAELGKAGIISIKKQKGVPHGVWEIFLEEKVI